MATLKGCTRCRTKFYARADAQYCTNACRQAAHRERRDRKIYPVKPKKPPKPVRQLGARTEWLTRFRRVLHERANILSKAAVAASENGSDPVVTVSDAVKIANTLRQLAVTVSQCYCDYDTP